MRILKLICLALVSVFLSGPLLANAAEPLEIKISPLIIQLEARPGQQEQGTITLTNLNNYEIKVTTEIEDFWVSDEKGTPEFLPESAGKTTLVSWIEVEKDSTMVAHEEKKIPFKINVPENAKPGGHYAGVLFKAQPAGAENGQLAISGRVGTLILVAVPGEINKKGEIIEFKTAKLFDKGPANFLVRFQNSGTVHYQPEGKIQIYNWFGKKTAEIDLSKHFILPGTIYQFDESWSKKLLFGKYSAILEMKDGDGGVQTQQLEFFAFPWQETLILLALIGLLIVAVKTKKRFKKIKNTKKRSK